MVSVADEQRAADERRACRHCVDCSYAPKAKRSVPAACMGTPTNAMNRAGTGLKNPDLDHRMEYFDPKTRPHSIFLDEGVLLSSPPDVIRSTATTVFAGATWRKPAWMAEAKKA